jgi:hypothetical protein
MKKIVLISIALALCIPVITFAADVTRKSDGKVPGTPFQNLQRQIDQLNTKLNNIQLTPGPQGPQGPAGPVGPAGPQGPSNELAIANEISARHAADSALQNNINQLAGFAKTYAGSAFAASIEQGGESWSPNFEGYGYMEPAPNRTGIQAVAVVTLNKDVQLPDGAVVTQFSCYWYDNDPDGDIHFIDANVFRRELLGVEYPSLTSMARIVAYPGTVNLDEIQVGMANQIDTRIIDNASFSYYINVVFSLGETTPALSGNIRWYGCQVRYKMP